MGKCSSFETGSRQFFILFVSLSRCAPCAGEDTAMRSMFDFTATRNVIGDQQDRANVAGTGMLRTVPSRQARLFAGQPCSEPHPARQPAASWLRRFPASGTGSERPACPKSFGPARRRPATRPARLRSYSRYLG
jgi:hypothetical protein